MIVVAGTTYRTGTTLIQRLINTSSEERVIYGEDNAILQCVSNYLNFNRNSFKRSNAQTKIFKKDKNSFTANMLPLNQMPYACANFINSLYFNSGFKVLSPTIEQIKTLAAISDAKIVLMYRNVQESWRSYQSIYNWVDKKTFFNYFEKSRELLKSSLKGELDCVYTIKYEDITRDTIERLFDWLEISNRDNIAEVLNLKLREMDGFSNSSDSYLGVDIGESDGENS